jgi:hypothetical protein
MKKYVTIVWSMAALAFLASPVLGSSRKKLRGGQPLREQEDSTVTDKNDGAVRRQHRVLERSPGGKPSVVEGNLGQLGVNPMSASGE